MDRFRKRGIRAVEDRPVILFFAQMKETGVKDTAAFRVIRQVVDHAWSSDEEVRDEDVVNICLEFHRLGGSWKGLMEGDVRAFHILERAIEGFLEFRNLSKIARDIASEPFTR